MVGGRSVGRLRAKSIPVIRSPRSSSSAAFACHAKCGRLTAAHLDTPGSNAPRSHAPPATCSSFKGGRAVHGWWARGQLNAVVWCGATRGTGSMQPQAEGPKYAHPQVVFFTCFFKAAALGFYLLGSWFTSSFVIDFVVCVLLIALDFWVVKNVSGRILVGLRWWNETDEAGETLWHFESLDQASLDQLSKTDAWVFWWTLYCTPALWLGLGLIQVIRLSFDYLLIIIVALVLGAANIYGYTKCRRDAKKQIQQFAAQTMAQNFASTLTSALAV
ncbi:unnamed protein product [Closterium sp. NIES-54]